MTGHEEFVQEFGRFGYDTDGNGAVGDAAFRNLALTANFPWVGEIASELYTQDDGPHDRRRHRDGPVRRGHAPRLHRARSTSTR